MAVLSGVQKYLRGGGRCVSGFVLNHMDVAAMLRLGGYKVFVIFQSCSPQAQHSTVFLPKCGYFSLMGLVS
jgi:hypothetical protein